jgi:hypothetical protein
VSKSGDDGSSTVQPTTSSIYVQPPDIHSIPSTAIISVTNVCVNYGDPGKISNAQDNVPCQSSIQRSPFKLVPTQISTRWGPEHLWHNLRSNPVLSAHRRHRFVFSCSGLGSLLVFGRLLSVVPRCTSCCIWGPHVRWISDRVGVRYRLLQGRFRERYICCLWPQRDIPVFRCKRFFHSDLILLT